MNLEGMAGEANLTEEEMRRISQQETRKLYLANCMGYVGVTEPHKFWTAEEPKHPKTTSVCDDCEKLYMNTKK